MDVGDPACDRVLDRDHGEKRVAAFYRGKRVLEGGAGKRLHLRKSVAAGKVRVGAWLALIGDFLRARCGHGFVGRGLKRDWTQELTWREADAPGRGRRQ